jgi:hypothetical protein
VSLRLGGYPDARDLLTESLEVRRRLGHKSGIAESLYGLGLLACHAGEYVEARANFQESLALFAELGDKSGVSECLEGLAMVAAAREQPAQAARLLGAAESLRGAVKVPVPPARQVDLEQCREAVRKALGQQAFVVALSAGRHMPRKTAVTYARDMLAGDDLVVARTAGTHSS